MPRLALSYVLLLLITIPMDDASAEDTPPNATESALELDPSSLPKFKGKVVQSLGSLNSYLPPRAGAEVQWDLKTLPEQDRLTFDPLPDDDVGEYYVPFPFYEKKFTANGGGLAIPLKAVSGKTYPNGKFEDMRWISQAERKGSPSVKVDFNCRPGHGHPNFVQIWVMVESDTLHGMVLIEGITDAPLSKPIPPKEIHQTTLNGKDPIETAIAFLREQKTDLAKHDVEKATASRYCPPQSTVYQWCVQIPARAETKAEALWITLPEKGDPWRLDPKTLEKLQ